MIVMFILMFLPVLELPLFWLVPWYVSVPVYVLSLPLTFWIYRLMRHTRKRPVTTGWESLIGREVEILPTHKKGPAHVYTVRTEGELWDAWSGEELQPGEEVIVTACRGNRLIVRKKEHEGRTVMKDRIS